MARKIEIEVIGDTSSLERALSRTATKSKSSFDKIGKAAGIAGAAIFAGLAVVGKRGFDELAASQKVMGQVEAAIKSTGGAANVTAEHVEDYSQSLLELSGVDDEIITQGQAVLLSFTKVRNEVGKGNDVFDQATLAALNLSTRMEGDLQGAIIQVGKALNDPIANLGKLERSGVDFSEAQEKLIAKLVESGDLLKAQKIILSELEEEFGGSAKAAGETLPAQLAKAQEAFDDVAATLVEALLPAVTDLLSHLTRFTQWAKENPKQMKLIVIGLAALATALVTASVAQAALNLAVLANPYVAAVAAIALYVAAVVILTKKFDFARKHWQLFLLAIPGIGVAAVVVATAVKFMVRHFDALVAVFNNVRSVATAVFNAVKGKVQDAMGAVRDAFNAARDTANAVFGRIKEAVQSAIDIFNKIKGMAGGAFATVADAIRTVLGPLNSAISAAQTLLDLIARVAGSGGTGGAGVGSANPRGQGVSGGHALGGRVLSGGLARVHTGEAIRPARVTRGGQGSSGGPWELALVAIGPNLARELQQVNQKYARGNGGRNIW